MKRSEKTQERPSAGARILEVFGRTDIHLRILAIVLVVVFIALAFYNPGQFLAANNFRSMGLQVSGIGLLTLAMSLTILIGGIDLSITAVANVSAIISGMSMIAMTKAGVNGGIAALVGILLAVLVGAILGMLNGIIIGFGRVTPILATMATLMLFWGFGTVLTGGISMFGFPAEILSLGEGGIANIPVPVIIFVVCTVLVWIMLNRTTFGFNMRLVGANPRAAIFSGIGNPRVVVATHTMAGVLASVAGLVTLATTDSANAQYGSSYILLTILIAVLGGVSIVGGKGRIGGIVLALVTLQLLSSGFNMVLAGVTGANFFRDFAWGLLLLIVLTATTLVTARRRRSASAELTVRSKMAHTGVGVK